jgi:chaperone modulatory protein CbpM
MLDAMEFYRRTGISQTTLEEWAKAEWIRPRQTRNGWRFSTIDLVRAQFTLDLCNPMGINEEGVGVILHLVDQIHGLRRALRRAGSTIDVQDASIVPGRSTVPPKNRRGVVMSQPRGRAIDVDQG